MAVTFLFATDLHGSRDKMTSLVKKAIEEEADLIILGGDLFRSGRSNTVDVQRKVLARDVQPVLEEFRGKVLTIFGNNDWYMITREMKELAPSLHPIEGEEFDAGEGLVIKGFSYVPVSPFMIKDWELYERTSGPLRGARESGLCSRSGEVEECMVDEGPTIMDRLEMLGDIRGKLLISHTPPFGTSTDMGDGGSRLGSMDLRNHIMEKGPLAVLCGHIHESPLRSGKVLDRLEDTIIGNPGSLPDRLTCIKGSWNGELHLKKLP